MQIKDDMLEEIRNLNEELRSNISIKTEEIKLLIDRMENYRKVKEAEIIKMQNKQKQTEQDLKTLIQEHEKQKRNA